MTTWTVLVVTSDLSMMSSVNAAASASHHILRCVASPALLETMLREQRSDDLCILIDVVDTVTTEVMHVLRTIGWNGPVIALVDHPYPDIVQSIRLQGVAHVIKHDALLPFLTTITQVSS